MPTKDSIKQIIQAIADATGEDQIIIGYGTPGSYLRDATGQWRPAGLAWDESERTGVWPMMLDGISRSFGSRQAISGNYVHEINIGKIGVTSVPIGGLQVTLMGAASFGEDREVIIKDEGGNATVGNPIYIVVSGGGTMDGLFTRTITSAYGVLRLYSNGSQWSVF